LAVLIDTNVAILLRDREPKTTARIGAVTDDAVISVITHVELEGGVYSKPGLVETRRASLDILMESLIVLPFEDEALKAYSGIVAASGYARSKILDRMIAATALVHGLPLITINGADFRDIPGLRLEVWPAP
jgi:tRNA(fMet)-specific endonuclease VapC